MTSASVEHTYRYSFSSNFVEKEKGSRLQLATSGGSAEFPYFFQGQLKYPRLTGQLLRTLSKVVTTRFHIPPAMLRRVLATKDPVITSGGGLIRFEGFSACCSAYARVDLNPDAYVGVVTGQGTTNVDFNTRMRAALAQIRDDERIGLAIGTDEIALLRGADQIVERRVSLPMRWLKGFVEIQAYQSRMERRAHLNKVETVRFLRSLPRTTAAKNVYWIVPAAGGLRLSQREAPGAIRLAGIERLQILDDIAPLADSLTVFADERGDASEWELRVGALALHLTLSAEVWRGFSGEGQVLASLAGSDDNRLIELVKGMLKWQAEIHPEEFAQNWNTTAEILRQTFAILGSRGLVGYDLSRSAYFHRELPFDLSLVEELHPRLKNARKIVESGGVQILRQTKTFTEAEVPGSDVTHRVRLSEDGDRCTCSWHAKHQGARGPCKHILATMILTEPKNADEG